MTPGPRPWTGTGRPVIRAADRGLRTLLAVLLAVLPLHAGSARADIANTASVTALAPSGTVLNGGPATAIVSLEAPAPALDVAKTATLADTDGSGDLTEGDVIAYQMTASNTGNIAIAGITIADVITQGPTTLAPDSTPVLVSGDTNTNTLLDLGEVWTWTTSLTLSQAMIDAGGTITNRFEVEGTGGGLPTAGSAQASTGLAGLAQLALAKQPVQTGYSTPGETIQWQITLENTGNLTLINLALSDPGAETIICPVSGTAEVASLAPGASETCIATTTVAVADLEAGLISNTASVAGQAPDGSPVAQAASASLPVIPADLVTVKTLDTANPVPEAGEVVAFRIQVTNNGPATATNVQLTDLLPAGLVATAGHGAASLGTYAPDTGLWLIGTLAPGASADLVLEGTVAPAADGVIANVTTAATADQWDPGTNGDERMAAVSVTLPVLVAINDSVAEPFDPALDHAGILDVLSSDTVNGLPATTAQVVVTPSGPWPAGMTLGADGMVSLAQGMPEGPYQAIYRMCQIGNPANCAEATVSVLIAEPEASLSGVVFADANQNGIYDPAVDNGLSGYRVEIWEAGASAPAASTISGPDGGYLFADVVPGTYAVVFLEPVSGLVVGRIDAVAVDRGDVVIDQNLPIDPSGVIYDAVSGTPIAGAVVRLADASGTPLPASCLLAGQQAQTTASDGVYRFDLLPGGAPQCPTSETAYRILVDQPAGYGPAPSVLIAPLLDPVDATSCPPDVSPGPSCALSASPVPSATAPSPYALVFLLAAGDPDVVRNHIPIDPLSAPAPEATSIAKAALVSVARRGETVSWRITLSHAGPTPAGPVDVIDTLPAGFAYIDGSLLVDGAARDPDITGRSMVIRNLVINPGQPVVITLQTQIGAAVEPGEHVNEAVLADPATGAAIGVLARARIRIEVEPVFDCGDVIGTVFDDRNRNGYRDEGEAGLAGIRLATVRGTLITTDAFGRYSLPCAEVPDSAIGSNLLLKLDERSLPAGYRLTSENPRVMRMTAGKAIRMDFGAASRPMLAITLTAEAFQPGSDQPIGPLASTIRQWPALMIEQDAGIAITYRAGADEQALARQRIAAVRTLLDEAWRDSGHRGNPEILIQIIGR